MKTLELNQLKNYLGTGLQCEVTDIINPLTGEKSFDVSNISGMFEEDGIITFTDAPDFYLSDPEAMTMKPICYPLSMLTEEIEHPVTGEKLVFAEMVEEKYPTLGYDEMIQRISEDSRWINQMDFMFVQLLIEHHFWIFDQEDFGTLVIDKSKIN